MKDTFIKLGKIARVMGKVFQKEVSIYLDEEASPVAFISFSDSSDRLGGCVAVEPVRDTDTFLVVVSNPNHLWSEEVSMQEALSPAFWEKVKGATALLRL